MKRTYYETHNLEQKALPIIFHHDVLRKKPRNYLMGFNWHENIEIIAITQGSGHIICNSEVYEVAEGDLFIFNSNELHGFKTEDLLLYDCLIVDSAFLAQHEINVTKLSFTHLLRSTEARRLYRNVVAEIEGNQSYKNIGIRTGVLNLLLYLVRNHCQALSSLNNNSPTVESVKRAIHFINQAYAAPLTLEEIAAAAGLSKYHFAREFKKVTQVTVMTYLNMIRCNRARLLILSHNYSVNAAALECGYENASYFSRTFRSIMGYLPSEIKKLQE